MTWIHDLSFAACLVVIVVGVLLVSIPAGIMAAGFAGLVLWWMFSDDGSDDAKDRSLPPSF